MDAKEQAEGEKRVAETLVDPLIRRGLMRPAGMTVEQFEMMLDELKAKLAYMTAGNLGALEEIAAGLAGGKGKDRFPIAQRILEQALVIQPPGDDASPLIRAVFRHGIGRDAIAEGWAPELLREVRKSRRFPNTYVISQLRSEADAPVRKLRYLDEALKEGRELSPDDADFRARRLAALDKCRAIRDMGTKEDAA